MWIDNASDIDILFYEPYADIIAEIAQNPDYKPLTVGVFGVWGAGKSTLLKLIENKIPEEVATSKKKNICININSWSFEGYEDAKVAVMESLLRELKEKDPEGLGKKILNLIKRLNLFKLSTKAVSIGAPIAASLASGNPLPLVLGITGNAEDIGNGIKNAAGAVQELHDNYLKPDTTVNEESIVNNIRKFRDEFEKTLKESDVENVIVLIDDLDRCQPDRIIETLEAIKLFLSVNKTVFVIAADNNVIQYAIRKKYPPLENFSVNLDEEYIEKIIQLPITIPDLSGKDIENYLMLLVAQQYCSSENFAKLIRSLREEKFLLSENVIDIPKLQELANGFVPERSKADFSTTAEIIAGIKEIIAGNLKGNPRQAKRFLNTFITKKKLAEIYYGKDGINPRVLAKLLVLQKLDSSLFIELNDWNKNYKIENEEYKKMMASLDSDSEADQEKYKSWHAPVIRKWVESEPKELEKENLDRYFYLTRESLRKQIIDESSLSQAAKNILQKIGNATQGLISSIISEMKELSPTDVDDVFKVLLPKVEQSEIELYIVRELFVGFEAYRVKIVASLSKTSEKIKPSGIPVFKRMYEIDSDKIDDLLETLNKANLITENFVNKVKGKEDKK